VGFWAAECLSRLRHYQEDPESAAAAPSRRDLAQLASFAAVAALRAGLPCDLTLPLRGGALALPTLGVAHVQTHDGPRWARVRLDRDDATGTATAGSASVHLPTGPDAGSLPASAHWTPAPRLRVHAKGIGLDIVLDTSDPYLAQLGPVLPDLEAASLRAWQRRIQDSWGVLVRHSRPAARALAIGVTTLIPLQEHAPGQPSSASSGWAWGAIALSLPRDALSGAEALLHEFHHLVLSAIEDLVPLLGQDDGQLYYSPWREDPRPLRGLLQGAYAYLGVTEFWRRMRHVARPAERLRCQVEFARRRQNTMEAVRVLHESATLTEFGRIFVGRMQACVAAWQREDVPAEAAAMAAELVAEHRRAASSS
jgi:HEXXH motif-containing protein